MVTGFCSSAARCRATRAAAAAFAFFSAAAFGPAGGSDRAGRFAGTVFVPDDLAADCFDPDCLVLECFATGDVA